MREKKLQIFRKAVGPGITDDDLKGTIAKAQKFGVPMVTLYRFLKWGTAQSKTQ